MRVALLANSFVDYTVQMANALQKRGEEVLLLMPLPLQSALDQSGALDAGVTVRTYRQPRLYDPSNVAWVSSLLSQMDAFSPQIVHSQGMHPWMALSLPLISRRGWPLVVTFHDPRPHLGERYLRTRFANYCGRLYCQRALVHGERLKREMVEDLHIAEERVSVIPFGEHQVHPFLRYWKEGLEDDGRTILFFGRIYAYKGLEYLIRAEPLISREFPDARIVIAGRGEKFGKYRDEMVNPDRFIVLNRNVSYEEGATLFQQASIVALPYIDASQSGVIPTAYGFRKPVVVTDVGSIPEIVDHGVTGLIVPPRDPPALAAAILSLLKDDEQRRAMGESGYHKLKTDMSWDAIAGTLLRIYREVAGE